MSNESEINVKVVRHYDPMKDDFITIRERNNQYVTEGIEEDYKDWTAQTPLIISAQTGRGKNTFIENLLIKFVTETERKILIVSNRVSSNRQTKERIARIMECDNVLAELTSKGLEEVESFKNVRIVTYQKLGGYLDDAFERQNLHNFDIVVLDEVHFFCSDALFNNQTGVILDKSLVTFKNSLRIYMTATPEEILPVIIKKEKAFNDVVYSFTNLNFGNKAIAQQKELLLYDFSRDYSYIKPKYLDRMNPMNQLIDIIKKDNSSSKYIVFVTSKEHGINIVSELGDISTFITADSKISKKIDGKIYNEIITQEKFSCKVLVCTSVLDNGVNIKDHLVKNIVIFTTDRTEFLQMIGRKRIENDEKVNLYICDRGKSYFNAKLYNLNKQIEAICCFKNSRSAFLKKYPIGSLSNSQLMQGIFYFEKSNLRINELAEKKVYHNKEVYERAMKEIDEKKDSFIRTQLSWMQLEKSYDDQSWVSFLEPDENKAKFIKFLDDHCDIELIGNELEEFQVQFRILFTNAYEKLKNDEKKRVYKATKMREAFEINNLQYDIKIKEKVFVLSKR